MPFLLFIASFVSSTHAETTDELAWRIHETCRTTDYLPNSFRRKGHCEETWSEYDTQTWTCKAIMIGKSGMDDGFKYCTPDPEPNVTLVRVAIDKDWLSKVAATFYGPTDGPALTQTLCARNIQRGLTTDCATIAVGQKLLLPPVWELKCENAGEPNCSNPSDEEFARILAALPAEVQSCVAVLRAKEPNDNKAHTVMLAKEAKRAFDIISAPLSSAECRSVFDKFWPGVIPRIHVPYTFVTLEANGVLKIVDFWGP